ncbi:MAG TPA: type II toxin-antitoxin system RelE/ParE family toxin [Candidatus Nanoarchaeia archaeon]|nr:type II toxin-antitoxin system RelE/ParE family toxin [Candidatus Nanoarchaeia archaeon]
MYALEYSDKAKRFLKRLDRHILERIFKRIERLQNDPVPADAKFMGREEGEKVFRYRIGDYRALYKVKEQEKVILITNR